MLGRYHIVRGKRPPDNPLPEGHRQDTRKHTRHVLRPATEDVVRFMENPGETAWQRLAKNWRRDVEARFAANPAPFEALAELAKAEDVWIGCSCPTAKNPDVRRCHTFLALQFMAERFPDLEIVWPAET